ncbi:hypothetical protein [Aliagarivorans marinus]|nr:hypothetical protein [Aliagarivorans marinus]
MFADDAAHATYLESLHFKTFMETISPLVEGEMAVEKYSPCFPADLA